MKINLISARDCIWADAEHTIIDMWATFDIYPGEELPFSSNSRDNLSHVQDAYARALAGEFGPIAEFRAYVPTEQELIDKVRLERNNLLLASDWTQLPDVPQATKDAWAFYRQALRDITAQEGFPNNVVWPTLPV